jgi:WD40 repeat protein
MFLISRVAVLVLAQAGAPASAAPVDTAPADPVRIFEGHEAAVYDVALSPDGSMLATASFDKSVKLWSVATGAEIATLKGHTGKVLSVAFSADGRMLLTGSEDKTVKLWDVPADSAATIASHGASVESFFISADGKLIVTASSDKTARVWNRASGAQEKKFDAGAALRSVAIDPGGKFLAAGGDDKIVRVWRLAPPPKPEPPKPEPPKPGDKLNVAVIKAGDNWKLLKGKAAPPGDWNKLGFDDSKWATAASGFGYSSSANELSTVKTKLDDMKNDKFLSIYVRSSFDIGDPKAVKKIVLKALYDDGFVAYLNGEEVARANIQGGPPAFNTGAASANEPTQIEVDLTPHIGKLKKGKNVLAIQAHNASVTSSDFVFTPSVDAVFLNMEKPAEPKKAPPKPVPQKFELTGSGGVVHAVALSADGSLVAGGGDDKTIRIWQTSDGKEIKKLAQDGAVLGLVFTDANTLVAAGEGGAIRVWNVGEAKITRALEGHKGTVRSLAWHAAKKLLLSSGDDGSVRLWSVAEGKQLREISGHEGAVLSVGFSADGTSIVTGGADKTLRVWNVADGKEVAVFANGGPVRAAGMHGDGKYYCAAQGSGILDWRVTSTEAVRTLSGHGGYVHCVAFSPDGSALASAGQDKTIRFWNPADGKQIRSVEAHTSTIYCIDYNHDGSLLASGGYDRTVKLWKTADGTEAGKMDGHQEGVFCLLFSHDGQSLFSGSSDLTVRRWKVADGKELGVLEGHRGWVTGLGLSGDGKQLLSIGYGGRLLTWNVDETKPVLRQDVGPVVYSLAVSRDGAWVVTGNPKNNALLLKR